MRYAFLLLVLPALLLTGCRDALVDEPPGGDADPYTNDALPRLYLKGPSTLDLTTTGLFRAQAVDGADDYRWTLLNSSTARLNGTVEVHTDGLNRVFLADGIAPGVADLRVTAYDADGEALAETVRHIDVVE